MTTDTTAGAPRWASNADSIGDLAIRLAARATSVEEENGEWTWRDIAAAALQPAAADMVLVPRVPTRAWASRMANMRQGQSATPRCEPPGEYEIDWALARIKEVLAAAPTAFEGGKKDG